MNAMIIHPVVSATPSHPEKSRANEKGQDQSSEETLPRFLWGDAFTETMLSDHGTDEIGTGVIRP